MPSLNITSVVINVAQTTLLLRVFDKTFIDIVCLQYSLISRTRTFNYVLVSVHTVGACARLL